MRVCVVGGTGNISISFVRLLLQLGHEVTCYNRGQSPGLPEGAKVIVGDRADEPAYEAAMQTGKFDAAIDMICFNAQQAASSVRAFRGVKHFVQCSTVCTYGVAYDWLPATEDHPLRPISDYGRNKVKADAVFLEAFHREGFPVTIIKPSTTYGPKMGVLRQIAWEFTWIDRVRKGKPIVVCGDGNALHQYLHVDDAALCFAHVVGRERCIGQTYNMVNRGFTTWTQWHRTAMRVIGREVEIVGIPFADLDALDVPGWGICKDIFAHHVYYSSEKLFRDVPEFQPRIGMEQGIAMVLEAMDRGGRVPTSDGVVWEDKLIERQRRVRMG
ncbi:MAG: NAD-dependent epimerase/dehydratase family protein [Planctomycetota bacterium]|nr:NAD-dependent epimerase/dehydratase family protein [Planctomycetota bacterium]